MSAGSGRTRCDGRRTPGLPPSANSDVRVNRGSSFGIRHSSLIRVSGFVIRTSPVLRGLVDLQELHKVTQHAVRQPLVPRVVLGRVVEDLLVTAGAEDLLDVGLPLLDHALDDVRRRLDVVLEADQAVLEAEGLVAANL